MKSLMKLLWLVPLLFSSGCSGSKSSTGAPQWVSKSGIYEDAIVAAGLGEGLDERTAKTKADLDGRKRIAETLQIQIKNLTTSFMEEASTGKVSESVAQEYFQEVTQSVTNVTLSGAQIEEYWPPFGQADGNRIKIYAKVVMKKNAMIDEFKKKVKEDVAAKKIKGIKDSADEALKALDHAISKWETTKTDN
jgi:hypothetical protein